MSSGEPPDSNAGGSPSQNNTQPNAAENAPGTGRNFTVSIQYSYIPLVALANPNGQGTGDAAAQDPAGNGNNGTADQSAAGSPAGTATPIAAGIPTGAGAAAMPQAADSFVLSFRDIPSSTPQSRLESIISLTAELAMRRFREMHARPTGIPREEFEKLPVLTLKQVREKNGGADMECSICYDPFVEEPATEDKISTGKRARDDHGDEETQSRIDRVKRQRTESSETADASATDAQNTPEGNSQATQEDVHYLHSPVELPCHHIFGRDCIFQWSKTKNSCPLCRHKISEAVDTRTDQQFAMNPATVSEFERLRNMLYNPPAEGEEGADAATNGTPAANAETIGNVAFNAPNIIFLTPETLANRGNATPAAPAAPANTSANSGTNTAAGVPATASTSPAPDQTGTPAPAQANTPVANPATRSITLGFPTNGDGQGGINWIPLPMRYLNVFNGDARTTSNPGPNGIPSTTTSPASPAAGADTAAQENGTTEGTRYERLRSMLRGIFDSAERNEADPAAPRPASAPATDSSGSAGSVPPSSRLHSAEIRRHANNIREALLRNAANGAHMFGSGVASYRDANGNVVTSELPAYSQTRGAAASASTPATPAPNSATSTAASQNTPATTQEATTSDEHTDEQNNSNNEQPSEDTADNGSNTNDPST